MRRFLKTISRGLGDIIFPRVCVCCGRENTEEERQLCSFCLKDRFQDANPDNEDASSDTLLPKGVKYQHALWKFDKGGDLQYLLHQLKYQRLTTIGVDLGRKLGERVRKNPKIKEMLYEEEAIILPVPLHYLKYRYRGFNQAFKVASGFHEVWPEIPICNIQDIVRTKNTRTQTGLSLEKRLQNIENAFRVRTPSVIEGRVCIIIDDVFTTGATTFEMAQTVMKAGSASIIILTIAQA